MTAPVQDRFLYGATQFLSVLLRMVFREYVSGSKRNTFAYDHGDE
ncbi:hypothetical protein [uncultured Chryseobacterium sp.]|nr:hypothetical protein [uncultured Chryseobacterium sp.]